MAEFVAFLEKFFVFLNTCPAWVQLLGNVAFVSTILFIGVPGIYRIVGLPAVPPSELREIRGNRVVQILEALFQLLDALPVWVKSLGGADLVFVLLFIGISCPSLPDKWCDITSDIRPIGSDSIDSFL